MLLAFGPDDLRQLAIPIGVGIAALVLVLIPGLRKSVLDSFQKGHQAGERMRGAKTPDDGSGSP